MVRSLDRAPIFVVLALLTGCPTDLPSLDHGNDSSTSTGPQTPADGATGTSISTSSTSDTGPSTTAETSSAATSTTDSGSNITDGLDGGATESSSGASSEESTATAATEGGCAPDERICEGMCILQGQCCGGPDCGEGEVCIDHECVDDGPPEVLAFSPSDGESGVTEDAVIRITFSEPMNQASVESALSLTPAPSPAPTMAWDESSSVLTINDIPLEYQVGTDQTTRALQYSVSVSSTATDARGDAMQESAAASFTTLRRITETLAPTGIATFDTYGYGNGQDLNTCSEPSQTLPVGRFDSGSAGGTQYTYVAYDFDELGAVVGTIESAPFRAHQDAPLGDFYVGGGRVFLEVLAQAGLTRDAMAYGVAEELGTFTTDDFFRPQMQIDAVALDSWQRREPRLFRLSPQDRSVQPPAQTGPQNTAARYRCEGFSLQVSYLVP